ncbi:MAG: HAD family hydrolase [Candidatus Mcinerneyibacterium aminivorans]|uniref:HAD family hydrolase n=1 Tax=Candidatus Mcinerneyibacterium aminivorans TaxID=2703815 RepID=A0A5D0MHI0_9BACT|nr:MAG: HAD family hydrolase [Candidatus Mcinerneyibacterium aminivorans]
MKEYLFFFDVNGTLIKDKPDNDLAYKNTLNELFTIKNPLQGIQTTARSDKKIFEEFLEKHKIKYTKSIYKIFLQHYEENLTKFSKQNIWESNINVKKFIKFLINKQANLALLTGNLKIGAKYKLESIELWRYFEIGGFGEDGETRRKIAETALKKTQDYFNLKFDNIFVIGDTEKDIDVAKYLNSKSIIFVKNSRKQEELEKFNPDFLINNFEKAMEILDNEI